MVSFGRDMTGKTQAADGISVRRATGADAAPAWLDEVLGDGDPTVAAERS